MKWTTFSFWEKVDTNSEPFFSFFKAGRDIALTVKVIDFIDSENCREATRVVVSFEKNICARLKCQAVEPHLLAPST